MLKYINDFLYEIYNKLFIRPFYNYSCYKNFCNIDKLKDNPEYIKYKKNKSNIDYTIFALNSTPELVHRVLFNSQSHICPKFYQMYYELQNGIYQKKYNNLITIQQYLDDKAIRYIFIRINLINNKSNHVNSIIIDKKKKFLLYFEPQCELRLYMKDVQSVLEMFNPLSEYDINFMSESHCRREMGDHCDRSLNLYDRLIKNGIGREIARTILPQNIYTKIYWTMSLQAIIHFLHQRLDKNSQLEIQQLAEGVYNLLEEDLTKLGLEKENL